MEYTFTNPISDSEDFNFCVLFQMSSVLGFGSGHSNRESSVDTGASPLRDRDTLDQVIRSLLDFQPQQTPVPQQSTLNRFHQLSRSLRQSSRRSSGRRHSSRNSFRQTLHSLHESQGE